MFSNRIQQEQTGMRTSVLIQQQRYSLLMGCDMRCSATEAEFFFNFFHFKSGCKSATVSLHLPGMCRTAPLQWSQLKVKKSAPITLSEAKGRLFGLLHMCLYVQVVSANEHMCTVHAGRFICLRFLTLLPHCPSVHCLARVWFGTFESKMSDQFFTGSAPQYKTLFIILQTSQAKCLFLLFHFRCTMDISLSPMGQ